jgi:spermidine/putrescine transport system ATP-binding protein
LNEVLVELKNITKRYGPVTAVEGIDLSIRRGEFLVLLGPSGSGKTTILSILGGFTQPTEGTVLIDGKDVTQMPPAQRPTVTVFQDYALFPHMTVTQNVAFGLEMRGIGRAERLRLVEQALGTVGLSGYGARRIHELSGGQRQRVALARAIVVEPAVLLLDEPLGALDLKIRQQMQDELVRLQKTLHATFVHVTHDQEEAMSIADNVVLVNGGRIEDYGPPERVYLRPATLFAATFMGDSNILSGRVASAGGGTLRVDTPIGQMALAGHAEPGSNVHISIRPEKIRVGPASTDRAANDRPANDRPANESGRDGETVLLGEGDVTELVFQGTHRRCRLRAGPDGGTELLARVPLDLDLAIGSRAKLETRIGDLVLLRN